MSDPKISIVIPMYNVENFIETTIKSILAQTFKDFELIIVDDCSTDRSFEIAQRYKDPRIKLFQNMQNKGYPGYGFNKGLELTKYVYFMDSDDAITGDTLEKFYNAAEQSQAEVVYMNSHYVALDPNFQISKRIQTVKTKVNHPASEFMSEDLIERLQREHINVGIAATPWIKFYRRDFLFKHQIYFPDVRGIEDFFHNFATLYLAKKILVIDSCCYIYRQNFDGVSRKSNTDSISRIVESFSTAIKFMEEIFQKDLAMSRENQLLLEAHAIEFLIQERIVRCEKPIEDLDKILQDITTHADAIDPNVTRMLIHVISHLILCILSNDKNLNRIELGQKLFELKSRGA